MANERIGTAPCPLCRQPAGVTVSKSGLTVLTCNRCHCQLFTRSDSSDGLLRAEVTAISKPAPAAPAAPVFEEAPPAVVPEAIETLPAPPTAVPKKSAWDIY